MPSMAFAVKVPARLPLGPLTRVSLTTPQASLNAADRPLATPSKRCRCSASTPASRPTPGAARPGTMASPRTGLTPAGCPELIARYTSHHQTSYDRRPELLDAHFPRKKSVLMVVLLVFVGRGGVGSLSARSRVAGSCLSACVDALNGSGGVCFG